MKYDVAGRAIWMRSLSSADAGNRASALSLAAADGFLYAAGYSGSAHKPSDYAKIVPTLAVWKIDPDGNNVWSVSEKAYKLPLPDGSTEPDMGLLASGGHLYLAAAKASGAKSQALVLKYDAQGKLLWSTAWTSATNKGKPTKSFATALADGGDRLFVAGWAAYAAASKDGEADEDVIVLEMDKRYGSVLAGHEYGEARALERPASAVFSGGSLFVAGSRRKAREGGKTPDADVEILKYEARTPRKVRIDILPSDPTNTVVLGDAAAKGQVTVAVLSSSDLNAATEVNRKSLRFGRTGAEPTWKGASMKDVDKDGKPDLLCTFKTAFNFQKTAVYAFENGDREGVLRGDLVTGEPFFGSDAVQVRVAASPEADLEPTTEPEPEPEPVPTPEPAPTEPEPQTEALTPALVSIEPSMPPPGTEPPATETAPVAETSPAAPEVETVPTENVSDPIEEPTSAPVPTTEQVTVEAVEDVVSLPVASVEPATTPAQPLIYGPAPIPGPPAPALPSAEAPPVNAAQTLKTAGRSSTERNEARRCPPCS